jgi:hypothetical protein
MAQTTPAPVDTPTRSEVLTLRETADYLRVSEDSVLAAVRQQELPGRQVRRGELRYGCGKHRGTRPAGFCGVISGKCGTYWPQ